MNKFDSALAVILAVLLCAPMAYGQSVNSDHTFKLDDPENQPNATLAEVRWLVGSWTGEAFGNTFEEDWNPGSAGTMVGMFKLIDGDDVVFYELMLLAEEEGSLNLKVKHFNADFSAWEEKTDHVTFPLVKIERDAVHFSGLSFYRINEDEIHGYLVLHNDEKRWEEKLLYRRRQ